MDTATVVVVEEVGMDIHTEEEALMEVVMVMPTMQRMAMHMVEMMDMLMKLPTRRIST